MKKEVVELENGLRQVTTYCDDGKTPEEVYTIDKDGKKQGPYEEYYGSGQLWRKCTYKDGKLDGPYERYDWNGELKKKCIYKNNEVVVDYMKDGKTKVVSDKEGIPIHITYCPRTHWWKFWEPKMERHEYIDKHGQLIKRWFEMNGKFEGPYEEYHENGKLYKVCTYQDGKLDGIYREYKENGQLYMKSTHRKGELLACEYYRKNGLLEERYTYKNGIKIVEKYYENGQLERKSTYKNGVENGLQIRYSREGEEYKEIYKDGDFVKSKSGYGRKQLNKVLQELSKTMEPTQERQQKKRQLVEEYHRAEKCVHIPSQPHMMRRGPYTGSR